MQIPQSNRNIIEDIFAASVRTSDIKNKFKLLAKFTIHQSEMLDAVHPQNSDLLKRIYAIVNDCEYYSLLSLELSWEIASSLIKELLNQSEITTDTSRLMNELNNIIMTIEDSLDQLYELINIELQLAYSIENCQLTYNRRFPQTTQA